MKNNILIIIAVTLVAVAVIAAVIIAGFVKDSESSSASDSIPDWRITSDSSSQSSSDQGSQGDSSAYSSADTSSDVQSSTSTSQSGTPSASTTVSQPTVSDGGLSAAQGIVATANSLIGVPFLFGGSTPDGFDNSGFIYYVLRENGFHNCPRGVGKQSNMGMRLKYSELKEGDLVFFYNDNENAAGFGGVYIGDGKMVAALVPSSGDECVMVADITTPYYQKRFYCGVALS